METIGNGGILKGNRTVVIINGGPRSGKDTVTDIANEILNEGYCESISSVRDVKKAGRLLGWDGVKNDQGRKFLSDLKDLSTEVCDGPLKMMTNEIENNFEHFENCLLFFMVREPEEIEKLEQLFPYNTVTLLVRRETDETLSCHADENVEEYDYDVVIDNNGTLEDLKNVVNKFIISLGYETNVPIEAKPMGGCSENCDCQDDYKTPSDLLAVKLFVEKMKDLESMIEKVALGSPQGQPLADIKEYFCDEITPSIIKLESGLT